MLLAATSIPIHLPPSAISCLIPGVGGRGRSPYNPGAGHGPVSLPEAFGGNRRLYTLAAPAADPFVGPRVYPRPKRVDRFLTDFYVIYILSTSMIAHDVENIVFYSVSWPSADMTSV